MIRAMPGREKAQASTIVLIEQLFATRVAHLNQTDDEVIIYGRSWRSEQENTSENKIQIVSAHVPLRRRPRKVNARGSETLTYDPSRYLLTSVDLPTVTRVVEAS